MRTKLSTELQARLKKLQGYRGVTVAVSGGSDSMALLSLLSPLIKATDTLSLAVFHVNFKLRDGESDIDQQLVADTARSCGAAFFCYTIDAHDLTLKKGRSTQEWARLIRQREFKRHAARYRHVIALAHHLDDLAENALYRLVRGASSAQLLGMQVFHPPFWRPLLAVKKETLLIFCATEKIAFRTDSSNTSNVYARNLIRNQVMPHLTKLHRETVTNMVTTCSETRELFVLVEKELAQEYKAQLEKGEITLKILQKLPTAKARILLRLLGKDITHRLSEKILAAITANETFVFHLPRRRILTSDGVKLKLTKQQNTTKVLRKQQYAQLKYNEQFCFVLEPGACAEIDNTLSVKADTQTSTCYRLHRPSRKEKVYWRGKIRCFKDVVKEKRWSFQESLRLYVQSSKARLVNQRGEVIEN